MPTPPLSDEQCLEAIQAFKETQTKQDAAAKLGINPKTYAGRLQVALARFGTQERDDDGKPEIVIPPPIVIKPTYRITAPTSDSRAKILICAIGDVHDSPSIPKDRLRWAGQHIRERKHDFVVQIGDFLSLESISRFAAPGTLEGKVAPYYREDMASFTEALGAFTEGLDGYKVEKHCTLGNHEDRLTSQMSRQPWAVDALENTPHSLLQDWGWEYSPYGAFHFVGQTALTHVPLNRMAKPFGGKFAENQIGNESTFDVVYGHSHRPLVKPFPKLNDVIVKVVNLGCFLPQNHVESYAQHTLHGWEWGLYDITLEGGHISKANWVPMTELEERYAA